jgi:hypothetical protein
MSSSNFPVKPLALRFLGVFLMAFAVGFFGGRLFRPSSTVRSAQLAAVIKNAGHGRVRYVQSMTTSAGIPVAEVRYPNGSLHTVFFFTKDGKIVAFIPEQPVYQPNGKILPVIWPKPLHRPTPRVLPHRPVAHPTVARIDSSDAAPAAVVLKYLPLARGFLWGKAKSTPIDAFVDPNCTFCHKWFNEVKTAVAEGKITFRIVPVAALKKSSVPRAIEILSAKDPLALWLHDENHFDSANEEGGLPINLPQNKAAKKAVAVNTAILYAIDNHHPFTPTFANTQNGQVLIGKNHDKELQHAFVQK